MSWPTRTCVVDGIKFRSLTDAARYIGVSALYLSRCASKKYCKTVKGHPIKFGPRVYEEERSQHECKENSNPS